MIIKDFEDLVVCIITILISIIIISIVICASYRHIVETNNLKCETMIINKGIV
jgi:hypothetical protein